MTVVGTARIHSGNPTGIWSLNVSGGTPPYTAQWHWRLCYRQATGTTACTTYVPFSTGPSGSAVALTPSPAAQYIEVMAQVNGSGAPTGTGVGKKFVPAASFLQMGSCSLGSLCCNTDTPNPPFPFDEWKYDTAAHTWVKSGRTYRWNACTGGKDFAPEPPPIP